MFQLSSDQTFHFESLRALAATAGHGSDVAECLQVFDRLKPGDFESWYTEWRNLAFHVLASIDPNKTYDKVSLRNVYFRVAHYFFVSDFFIHGNPEDTRIYESYQQWSTYFNKAISYLDIPGERHNIMANGFEVPAVVFRASISPGPRPTLLLGNGFDGSMEEMLHIIGFTALERGYNVVLYEGPGQPTVVRTQRKGFIYDWEKVVTPLVDYVSNLDFVNSKKVSLLGYSLGGYLALRAAAFEHRLAACILIDGVWDLDLFMKHIVPQAMEHYGKDEEAFTQVFKAESQTSTGQRWATDHLTWSFMATPYDATREVIKMKMDDDLARQVKCPVLVGEATEDQFFAGQPALVKKGVGEQATILTFGTEQAAASHCQTGAICYLSQEVFSWLDRVA